MKHLRALNKYFVKYKWWLIPGIFFVIISNIFSVIPAAVIGLAFNLITDNITYYRLASGYHLQNSFYSTFSTSLLLFGGAILALYLLRGIFLFAMRQTIILMSRHVEFDMKNEIYQHYQALSLGFYRKNKTGDLMNRATEDVSKVRMYVGPAIMYAINTVVLSVFIIYSMFSVNALLALSAIAPLPILVLLIHRLNKNIHVKSEEIQSQLSNLSGFVQEKFSGIRIIKSFVKERQTQHDFEAQSDTYKEASLSLVRLQAVFFPLMVLLIGLSATLTVYIGGIQVIKGYITSGNIAQFIVYVNQLTFPVFMLGWVTTLIQRASASQKRINEFLLLKPDIVGGPDVLTDKPTAIDFNNVTFRYSQQAPPVLSDINLHIQANQLVAIVGKTGSGKTTLANLIMRMYDVSSGSLTINGTDIKNLNLTNYRSRIGFVPQDVFLFSDTISHNICFGLPHVNQQAEVDAAKAANVHNNIIGFPAGYNTMLGERGISLSGGQKQRVSIARAFAINPDVIIFDDSLSAVDTQTEESILNNLTRIMHNKITIIIAHRISTIKHADLIVYMDQGKIVEQGTHQQLLQLNGAYAHMYNNQLLNEQEAS